MTLALTGIIIGMGLLLAAGIIIGDMNGAEIVSIIMIIIGISITFLSVVFLLDNRTKFFIKSNKEKIEIVRTVIQNKDTVRTYEIILK